MKSNQRFPFTGSQLSLFICCSILLASTITVVVFSLIHHSETVLTSTDLLNNPNSSLLILSNRSLALKCILLGGASSISALGFFFYFMMKQIRTPIYRVQRQLELMTKLKEFRRVQVRRGDELEGLACAINEFSESYIRVVNEETEITESEVEENQVA